MVERTMLTVISIKTNGYLAFTTMQAVSLCHKRPIACWGSAPIPLNDAGSIELNQKNFILYELDILTNVLLPVWRGLLLTTVSFL